MKPDAEGTAASIRLKEIPKLPDDNYALLFQGYMEIPETGVWGIAVGSDDGSRLFIDDELIADNDGPHAMRFISGVKRLKAGLHPVRIEFYEATGEADLQVTLTRDGTSATQEPKYYFAAAE